MRMLSHPHAADGSHGIDLAPMLDFVVNLLIFFIITAVFIKETAVSVNRPAAQPTSAVKTSKSFVIDDDGEISLDDKAIDLRAVRAHIEQFKATVSDGSIVIIADEQAPTGAVVSVVDQVQLGGVHDITFMTTQLATPSNARREETP